MFVIPLILNLPGQSLNVRMAQFAWHKHEHKFEVGIVQAGAATQVRRFEHLCLWLRRRLVASVATVKSPWTIK